MTYDLCRLPVENFLKTSWQSVETITKRLVEFKSEKPDKRASFFRFRNGIREDKTFDGSNFFLRSSVEYSNPQLTVEEVQGIIGVRLLEVSGNYFSKHGLHAPDKMDFDQICEDLKKPSEGPIIAFLLNTDDVEPDRYSMNPLKESIVSSGQSSFPALRVKTNSLSVDKTFVEKYEGSLISQPEAELLSRYLTESNGSYVDFVDSVKYAQLADLSNLLGVDLSLYALRIPLTTLEAENKMGALHYLISKVHTGFDSVKQAYDCMGRSMTKRTTLLTIPHSAKGYGSKRAARGRLHFNENNLTEVNIKYKPTALYPNAMDPNDVAIAHAEDDFSVPAEKLANYDFSETPSSPQFFLYSLASPEDAALWHGVGAFASTQLLHSYTNIRGVCRREQLFEGLEQKYGIKTTVPLQFNLAPNGLWVHPVHRNIDASMGSVANLRELARMGMQIEYLSDFK
jgi:hypothetical protein